MELKWIRQMDEERDEFPVYFLDVIQDDGHTLSSVITLNDYSDLDLSLRGALQKPLQYLWTYLGETSHIEEVPWDAHMTLEQVQREAEIWLLSQYIGRYESTRTLAASYKPLADSAAHLLAYDNRYKQ